MLPPAGERQTTLLPLLPPVPLGHPSHSRKPDSRKHRVDPPAKPGLGNSLPKRVVERVVGLVCCGGCQSSQYFDELDTRDTFDAKIVSYPEKPSSAGPQLVSYGEICEPEPKRTSTIKNLDIKSSRTPDTTDGQTTLKSGSPSSTLCRVDSDLLVVNVEISLDIPYKWKERSANFEDGATIKGKLVSSGQAVRYGPHSSHVDR